MRWRWVVVLGLLAVAGTALAAETPCGAGCVNVVVDGDSISAGTPGRMVADRLAGPARVRNVAKGGRPVFECLRLFPSLVAPRFAPEAGRNVILFHAGDNDIGMGRDAAGTYEAFTAYVAGAHGQGWRVVVTTEFRRPDFSPAAEAQLEAYNRLLLENRAGADGVVDMDADPRFADLALRGDASVFKPDRIHLRPGGVGLMLDRVAPVLRVAAGR